MVLLFVQLVYQFEIQYTCKFHLSGCISVYLRIFADVVEALLKLSFTVGSSADRIRYTADGRLVNTFTISYITPQTIRQVGD